MSLAEQIKAIEEEIRNTKYNKATAHHIGRLKARLARLREEAEKRAVSKSGNEGYSIKKSGDATVVLVGFPSVGKSTLLNALTQANSRIATYEFTTLEVIPGTMKYKGANIQILDLPGIVKGASYGKGRGKEVISVIRNADLALIMLDVFSLDQYETIVNELYNSGIRINSKPPQVFIKKMSKGGINISSSVKLSMNERTIRSVLEEYRIHNANITIREDITIDQLIDVIQGNRTYLPAIVVINKIDIADEFHIKKCKQQLPEAFLISADKNINIEELKQGLFQKLRLIRVYLKPQREAPDMDEPLIMKQGCTVGDICDRLHKDFRNLFRYAQVWGSSAKHKAQHAGLDHVLHDGDILTIVLRK